MKSAPRSLGKRLLTTVVITLIMVSPWIIGPAYNLGWLLLLIILAACVSLGLNGSRRTRWLRGPAIALLSTMLTVTLLDVALRPILGATVYYRPYAQYLAPWPPMPLIRRYPKNYHWHGKNYGDLAHGLDAKKYREYRNVNFVSDGFGYRNDLPGSHLPVHPLDVVVIGDSYGEGEGTSQEKTWASLLSHQYHLETYNLSIAGSSPWAEFATVAVMANSLPTRPGTIVVWALYDGNDLDDSYTPIWDPAHFPWQGPFGQFKVSAESFRDRSPVHLVTERLRHAYVLKAPLTGPDRVDGNPMRELQAGKPVLFFQEEIDRCFRSYDETVDHPHFKPLQTTIRAMKQFTQAHGLRLVVMLLPTKDEVYEWLLRQRQPWTSNRSPSGLSTALKVTCGAEGLPYFDAKPYLIDRSRSVFEKNGELLWWRDDSHMGPNGHAAVAAFVHDTVLAGLPNADYADQPPSMTKQVPVTKAASSESR